MEIRPGFEEEIAKRIRLRARAKLPCLTLPDRGPVDEKTRPFEVFDVFFAVPAACGDVIDPRQIDGFALCDSVIEGACDAICDRFKQLLPGFDGAIWAVGISSELHWQFGDEVIEAEAMLGDLWEVGATPGRLTFYARFVGSVDQIETRCRTAPITPPPPSPARPAPWARELSPEEEEDLDPPLRWFEGDQI